MVNPGAFLGSRRIFIEAQKDIYAAAVAANHVADMVADIQRRYFKRYPIFMAHDIEPMQEWLDQVDDSTPNAEFVPPEMGSLSAEDYAQQTLEYNSMLQDIKLRKDQIKRRLQYQHNKERDEHTSFEKGSSDPMAILMARLTGENIKRPCKRTPFNIWGSENRFFVDPVFKQRVEDNKIPAKQHAALRSTLYKEMFEELTTDEQQEWIQRAEDEHQTALQELDAKTKVGPLTTPEARQRIIQALPKFIEPILDLVADHTGWKVSLIAGGPEPADGGRLNMVSIHSGVTSGSIKMDFGRSERQAYRSYVIPTFGTFLKKCYSIEECRSRALSSDNTSIKLSTLGVEEDIHVHRFDIDPAHVSVARSRMSPSDNHTFPAMEVELSGSAKKSKSALTVAIKIGAPSRGRKKDTLRTMPSRDAATVLMPPLPSPVVPVPAAAARPFVFPVPPSALSDSAHASNSHELFHAPAPPLSHAPTPAPSPAPSRAPSPFPLLSREPTPAPSPAPSQALNPVFSPAPNPAALNRSSSPVQSMRLSGWQPDIALGTSSPFIAPAHATPSTFTRPGFLSSASRSPMQVNPYPLINPACTSSVSPVLAQALELPPIQMTPRICPSQIEGVWKPSGAATVPDPSFFAAACFTSKSRKRKAARVDNEGDDPGLSTRTRSSAYPATAKGKAPDSENIPAKKKQKRTVGDASSAGAFELALPSDCPAWVSNAVRLITSADLGAEWQSLAATWLNFERRHAFKHNGPKLGSQHRPRIVSDWIQRARIWKYRLDIKNLLTFEVDFRSWWTSLQPGWRVVPGTPELSRGGGEWDTVQYSGQNGILSVVACLFLGFGSGRQQE